MKQVRYGVIGGGAIAQRRHLPEGDANPASTIAAIAEPVKDRLEALASQYGAEPFLDYKRMLAEAELDAVVVAGPNHLHAPMTIDALNAGRHVLCEKPLATTRDDAHRMIAAAEANGKYLMVAHNQRLVPAHRRAHELLLAGRLGRVLSFRTAFKHPGPEGWSVDGVGSWFFQKGAAFMGVTGDLGIHKIDLIRWLLGQEFTDVGGIITTLDKRGPDGALIELDDNANLTVKTDEGVIGSIILSWTNYGVEENYTVVYCEHGVLRLVDGEYDVVADYRNGDREMHKVGGTSGHGRPSASGIIDTLTDCILQGRPPEIDGREGYRALNVVLTAIDAAKAGRVLKIDD